MSLRVFRMSQTVPCTIAWHRLRHSEYSQAHDHRHRADRLPQMALRVASPSCLSLPLPFLKIAHGSAHAACPTSAETHSRSPAVQGLAGSLHLSCCPSSNGLPLDYQLIL